ncbi:COMM domain-containing protein 9-like [Xenia sp. Carnegie-2017]|uniref:COMM domain-containing protein 9-like n=1 Tax=Xenia sp. Carnegie-2017 TaxID=2897299 RepID=UPI001F0501CD|nr:COMM domain-containing protein 9-like [Xenia sp. Carnegie-2017]
MVVLGQIDFDALNLLLKAKSKDVVAKLVSDAFDKRNRKVNAETFISITDVLDCDSTEAGQLFSSLIMLVKNCLYEGLGDRQSIASIFPGTFHKNLKDLLSKIIVENLTGWKEQAMTTQVSLPKLADFDWRVDVKTSSDAITRMSVPTCLLQLKIQENACKDNLLPELKCLNVELSKKTLDTMLDGLGRIRDQLSSVARSSAS